MLAETTFRIFQLVEQIRKIVALAMPRRQRQHAQDVPFRARPRDELVKLIATRLGNPRGTDRTLPDRSARLEPGVRGIHLRIIAVGARDHARPGSLGLDRVPAQTDARPAPQERGSMTLVTITTRPHLLAKRLPTFGAANGFRSYTKGGSAPASGNL